MGKLVALYVGGAAVVLALVFTLFPLGSEGGGVSCGNAWSNGDDVTILDGSAITAACGAARADRWITVTSMAVLGGALAIGALDAGRRQREAREAT